MGSQRVMNSAREVVESRMKPLGKSSPGRTFSSFPRRQRRELEPPVSLQRSQLIQLPPHWLEDAFYGIEAYHKSFMTPFFPHLTLFRDCRTSLCAFAGTILSLFSSVVGTGIWKLAGTRLCTVQRHSIIRSISVLYGVRSPVTASYGTRPPKYLSVNHSTVLATAASLSTSYGHCRKAR